MPFFVPAIIAGISALGGALSNRGGTSKTSQQSSQSSQTDMTTMPQYDPKSQALRDMLINMYMDQLGSNEDYFSGYTRQGLANLGLGSRAASSNISNMLAQRGIRGGAAGAALAMPQISLQNQMSSFLNQIPQMRSDRQMDILGKTGSFLGSLPTGQHQYGTQTSTGSITGTQTTPGNMLGGMFGNLGSTLAGLYGSGAFSKNPTSSGAGFAGTNYQLPQYYPLLPSWAQPKQHYGYGESE